jgi:hypothetical protein
MFYDSVADFRQDTLDNLTGFSIDYYNLINEDISLNSEDFWQELSKAEFIVMSTQIIDRFVFEESLGSQESDKVINQIIESQKKYYDKLAVYDVHI